MLGLGSIFSIPAVHAENSVQSQRTQIQSQITKARSIIEDLQAEQTKLTSQIDRIKEAIKENSKKINETETQINDTKVDVEALKQDIVVLEERIAQRQEVLKQRAVAFQESGGDVDIMGVLLGATSFQDFLGRVGAVAAFVNADQDILTQQEQDKTDLEAKKKAVQVKLDSLESMKADLEGMQADIKEQKQQSENTMQTLQEKEQQMSALKTSLEQKDSNLADRIAAILADKKKTADRQAALQDALNKAASQVQTSASNNSSLSSLSAPSGGNVSSAITAGYKYIGNSTYVWGGGRTASDVANGYFDCSGFVAWAYSQAGVRLPASTDGLKNSGTQVSTSQMQPGDLVFFNTYKTDGHVGIYVGNGKFIGSQSSTGVAIADMSSGYWASKFNGRVVRVK